MLASYLLLKINFVIFTRGAALNGENELVPLWEKCSDELKKHLGSVTLPIGSLSVGLCRHRALLFKVCYTVVIIVTNFYENENFSIFYIPFIMSSIGLS